MKTLNFPRRVMRPPKGTTERQWRARWWAHSERVLRVLKQLGCRGQVPGREIAGSGMR